MPSFGVTGTKTAEYCAQHAPDGMVDVKSRKCRTESCEKWPSFGVEGTRAGECCAQHTPDGMVSVSSRKCKTEGCGKQPSLGVPGTNTLEYCAQHASDSKINVKSKACKMEGCGRRLPYGVAGTKSRDYCTQHAPDGMVDVKSRKCRTRGCGRKPSFEVDNTRTAEFCAQHASLKCGVGGYREGEVDPHHSGKETVGNIRPNGVECQTVHPPANTSPPSEGSKGSRKREHYPEVTSSASMRPISQESVGGAGTTQVNDGTKNPVKRHSSVKAEVLLSL